jgi:DNA-binding SARP family transcriptional activator
MKEFRFQLLGPVRAWRNETEVRVGPPQQQAVLALLLLSRRGHVAMAALLAALWGDHPPKTGAGAVRTYISRLRQLLGAGDPAAGLAIEQVGDGYTLRGRRLSVDAELFEERVGAALLARRGSTEAADLCRAALQLWHGEPLAGVPGLYFEPVRARMAEMRADAAEIEAAAHVESGDHFAAIANLRTLITSNPLRENLHELLMLALYRAGRQADALEVYEGARRTLRDELGIEPGPSLKRMQQRVLSAEDGLATAPRSTWRMPMATSGGTAARIVPARRLPSGPVQGSGLTALALRSEPAALESLGLFGLPHRTVVPGSAAAAGHRPSAGLIPGPRSGGDAAGPLAARLRAVRQRAFVGRERETAAFRSALDDDAQPFTLLWVTGPGGVGKTSLLRRFAHEAEESGRTVVELDGRVGACTAAAFEADARRMLSRNRSVLIVDGFEAYRPLEAWLREDFLPRLPLGSIAVVADRARPAQDWRSDPAWHELVRLVELGPLPRPDAVRLLALRGLPEHRRDAVLAFAAGNPLALTLAADADSDTEAEADAKTDAEPDWSPSQDLIGSLLPRLVGPAPSAGHRLALDACALLPAANEELLRAVLPDPEIDTAAVFAWLRDLPFMESGPHGVHPHGVVRAVLDADLSWRDPERHHLLRSRIAAVRRSRPPGRRSPAGS